jgi:hypothetical protein
VVLFAIFDLRFAIAPENDICVGCDYLNADWADGADFGGSEISSADPPKSARSAQSAFKNQEPPRDRKSQIANRKFT